MSNQLYRALDPILEQLMAVLRRVERFLGPDDDWVEDDRRILFEAAHKRFGHIHPFIKEKSSREYLLTVEAGSDTVERLLMDSGYYDRNLLSNRKYRETESGRQWATGSYVYDPSDTSEQHHVYLFDTPNGHTDVYSHTETSVREGAEHITNPQYDSTDGMIVSILNKSEYNYNRHD